MARDKTKLLCLTAAVALALLSLSVHAHGPDGDSPIRGTCVACSVQHAAGVAAETAPVAVDALSASDAPPAAWVGLRPSNEGRTGLFDRGPPAA